MSVEWICVLCCVAFNVVEVVFSHFSNKRLVTKVCEKCGNPVQVQVPAQITQEQLDALTVICEVIKNAHANG